MSSKFSGSTSNTVKGSFSLLVGNVLSFVVNAIGAILVAKMLTPSEYGLYILTLILPNFFTLFSSWGVNTALTRFIAKGKTEKDIDVRSLLRAGYFFVFSVSSLLSLTLFLTADVLVVTVLKRPELGNYVRLSSLLILSQTIYQTDIAVLAGYEKMSYRASINVVQSIVKGIASPLLVYLGFGIFGTVIGITGSYLFASFLGFLLVLSLSRKDEISHINESFIQSLKRLIGYGFPLYIGRIITGIAIQFRGLLLSWYIMDEVIGNYGVANWFNSLVGVAIASIVITLLPTFSQYDINREPGRTKELYQGSIRYTSMVMVPLTCLVITSSKQIINLLFEAKYFQAPLFLSIILIPNLFIGFGLRSNQPFLNSQGKTRETLRINSLSAIMKIILAFLFIQFWGVEGLILSMIISSLAESLYGMNILKTNFGLMLNINHTLKTVISAVISGVLSHTLNMLVKPSHSFNSIIIIALTFLMTYLVIAPLLGAIDAKDINNLNIMLKEIRIIYPFVKVILNIERKIIQRIS